MERIDRRLFYHVDWLLGLTVATIVGLGIATVHSATSGPDGVTSPHAMRQLAWAGAGFATILVVQFIDYRKLERYAYAIYGVTLALLVLVPIVGFVGGGSRRWIDLGFFALQPSEIVKIGLVVVLARFFHRDNEREAYRLRDLALPTLLFAAPAALILVQPDLGSAALLGFVFASLVLAAGVRWRSLFLLLAAGALIAGLAGNVLWSHLKPYQQKRVTSFLDPGTDPLGAGYHVIQSEIAVGSGNLWGKGFRHGTQNRLNFLPEQHTDFIFAVYAEERGFAGAAFLLFLYTALVLRCLQAVSRAKDRFGALLAFGVCATIFWQAVINASMATGLLPVVGITLPFFSYGGSSMLTLLLGIGLVMNVSMRRFMF